MSQDHPSDVYDADYYAHGCGRPYQRDEVWLGFFRQVAARIHESIAPASALDAGCAMGFLVECLQELGVAAEGVDISDFAIGRAHASIRDRVRVGSVTEPFGRRYDLITCVEVLEHMPPAESQAAVANLCAHADDILFSSSPEDFRELTHLNARPPEYWAELFARHGFYRDLDFDASFLTPWAQRFRKAGPDGPRHALAAYERRLWQLDRESAARREVAVELRGQLAERERDLAASRAEIERLELAQQALEIERLGLAQERAALSEHLQAARARWHVLEVSPGFKLLSLMQDARARFLPPGSPTERLLMLALAWLTLVRTRGLRFFIGHLWREGRAGLAWRWREARRRRRPLQVERLTVAALQLPAPRTVQAAATAAADDGRPESESESSTAAVRATPIPTPPRPAVDIVVCVHNAPEDVARCLESILRHTADPYRILLVDDGSAAETAGLLDDFAALHPQRTQLLRNAEAGGYTRAANQGMAAGAADFLVLLNSDTIVTEGWLDRMLDCMLADPKTGIVGPLSNTASYQSIPRVSQDGDWAENPLPEGLDIDEMAALVAKDSGRLWPEMRILNGFCLLIRRAMVQAIGSFDEAAFGAGYGEENDYAFRAADAGWRLRLADDAYVWHAQSKSYSHERRHALAQRAGQILAERHGAPRLIAAEAQLRDDPVLEGIRARSLRLVDRQRILVGGRDRFAGRRLLFVLPLGAAGGGANIVIREARAMRQMGVAVGLFNLEAYRSMFEAAYPDLDLPVIYGREQDLGIQTERWDALVATHYATVEWLDLARRGPHGDQAIFGYYVQDVEAYFYPVGSERFHDALRSYRLMPELCIVTKTDWNAEELRRLYDIPAQVVGASYDPDIFRPRPRPAGDGRIRITAMVRPVTPFRSPEMTMRILSEISRRHGPKVDCVIFGVEPDHPGWEGLPRDFDFRLAGALHPLQVATLLAESDIFVDFSTHQAMGLTAMEAMASGCAVIVPQRGGASTFAVHEANALVIDTADEAACLAALDRLVTDGALRARLARQALTDICHFYPERPAFHILDALFGAEIDRARESERRRAAADSEGQVTAEPDLPSASDPELPVSSAPPSQATSDPDLPASSDPASSAAASPA
jgi:GT2 family glycosyltransferase/glycosyltransferase involved in cell wall biosynthesis